MRWATQRAVGPAAEADSQIDAVGHEVGDAVLDLQMQAQPRVGGEQRRQRRTEASAEADGHGDAQLALGRIAQLQELGLGGFGGGHHGGAAGVEALAGRCQAELARGAVQQRDAHVLFQRPDLLADGRGAGAQLPRGGGKAAMAHDAGEDGHAF